MCFVKIVHLVGMTTAKKINHKTLSFLVLCIPVDEMMSPPCTMVSVDVGTLMLSDLVNLECPGHSTSPSFLPIGRAGHARPHLLR